MTKELTDNFMELGLGASWKSGASDTVLNIMKGIRRGRKGGFFRKLSNGQIAAIMNNTRESLGLLRKVRPRPLPGQRLLPPPPPLPL